MASTDPVHITVRSALRLSQLRRGKPEVVAGKDNLDNAIRWAHAGEVPDIAKLLRGGEILLTTGMGIAETTSRQQAWIGGLAERGVAAVVLELGQVFDSVPPGLVEGAEQSGMPLIILHREIPFVEATEAIHSRIVGQQLAIMRRGEETHRRFTELMLEGAGIPEVLDALATTIGNPVLLVHEDGEVVFHAIHRTGGEDVLAVWEERRGEDGMVVPVPAAGRSIWGRLIALPLDSSLDEYDRVAVERAVAVVGLALLRNREADLLALRERGNFLAELASGRLGPADAELRAEALGFESSRGLLMVAAVTARPGTGGIGSPAWAPIWGTVVDELRSRTTPALTGVRADEDDALLLVRLPSSERRDAVIDQVVAAGRASARRHLGTADAPIIAVGGPLPGWNEVPAALRETAEVAHLARRLPPRDWHDATTADLDRLLSYLRSDARFGAFVERRLEPLLEHDRRRSARLRPTLESLLEHGGRKAETARALHLKRQSLYHRIERIEQLLSVNLDDPDSRLGLHLALRSQREAYRAPTNQGREKTGSPPT